MRFKNWFDKIKEFKVELDKQEGFSPREKESIFDSAVKKIIGESQESQFSKKIVVQNQNNEKREIQVPDSFASLVNKAKSSQHSDYVLLAVYHLIMQKKYESVSVKDIVDEYKKAYLKPSNTNVYLANLSRRGLLMPTEKKEGKTAFIITRDGIEYVGELLNYHGE